MMSNNENNHKLYKNINHNTNSAQHLFPRILFGSGSKDEYRLLLVHQHTIFVGKEGTGGAYLQSLDTWVLSGGVDMATLHIVRKENGLGINLLEKTLENFHFAPATTAIDWTMMAPAEAYLPLFFVDAHLGFRDVEELILLL